MIVAFSIGRAMSARAENAAPAAAPLPRPSRVARLFSGLPAVAHLDAGRP